MIAAPIAAQQPSAGTAKPTVVVPAGKPTVLLWPNGAPGSEARKDEAEAIKGETVVNVHNPSIIVFLPRKEIATGVGMIVQLEARFPGVDLSRQEPAHSTDCRIAARLDGGRLRRSS
ncbi:MAG TPA: hypothetical protein VM115_00905 [Vicinamibacterales bacterium]|nr:hypothetical protein [Vicinamibacterales bacterium]